MVWQWASGAAIVFTFTTVARIIGIGKRWHPFIPGGISVAVGKNSPLQCWSDMTLTEARHVQRPILYTCESNRRHTEVVLALLPTKRGNPNRGPSQWADSRRRGHEHRVGSASTPPFRFRRHSPASIQLRSRIPRKHLLTTFAPGISS